MRGQNYYGHAVSHRKTTEKSIMRRNEKAMLAAGCLVFVLAMSFLLADNIALRNEVLNLQEEMGINREGGAEIGANIRLSVMRLGESKFTTLVYVHNVMTTMGLNWIRRMIADQTYVNNNATTNASHYIAIGTGSGGDAASTALQTEFARAVGTYALPSATNWTLTYTWTAGTFDADTITEAGCFDEGNAEGGILLNYQDFTGILLNTGDSLQVQFEFDVS